VLAAQDAPKASQATQRLTHGPADRDTDTGSDGIRKACETVPQTTRKQRKIMPSTEPSAGVDEADQPRLRGRTAKSDQSEAEIVEWWEPGWRERT
jgi:hypothetical protein